MSKGKPKKRQEVENSLKSHKHEHTPSPLQSFVSIIPPCMTRAAAVLVTSFFLAKPPQALPRSFLLYPRPTLAAATQAPSFLASPSTRRPHLLATRTMASSSATSSSSPSSFSPDPTLKAKKAALRKSITARLRALDDTHVTAEATRLFPRLLGLEAVQGSECLSLYLSMPSKEMPTFPVLLTALMEGGEGEGDGGKTRRKKQVYVPKVGFGERVGREGEGRKGA